MTSNFVVGFCIINHFGKYIFTICDKKQKLEKKKNEMMDRI